MRRANCDTRRHQPQPVGDIAHSVPQRYRRPNRRSVRMALAEPKPAMPLPETIGGFRLLFEQRFDQHGFLVGAVERLAYHVAAREQTGGVCRNDALGIRFVI